MPLNPRRDLSRRRQPSIRHTDHETRLRRRVSVNRPRWGMKQHSGFVAMKDGSRWGIRPAAFIKEKQEE